MNRRHLLLAATGIVAVLLLGLAGIDLTSGEYPATGRSPTGEAAKPSRDAARSPAVEWGPDAGTKAMGLEGVFADRDPVRRQALLRQWAALVDTARLEETLAGIESMENPGFRTEVCRALLGNWIQRDMGQVAAWFGAEGSQREVELRMEARGFLLDAMGKWEPEQALAWLETSLPPMARDLLYEPFFLQWADTNPAAACAKLYELADGRLLAQVAARWAKADLAGAVNWVKSLPEGPIQAQAMLEVSYLWTGTSPSEAAAYASQQNNPELLRAVVGKWADQSPKAAAAWVKEWPPGFYRDTALAHLAQIWAQNDPTAAAAYTESLPAGAARDKAMVEVATVWAYAAPDQSAKWISRLPEGAAREQALSRLIGAWAGAKPQDAGEWIQTLPDGGSTDLAVSAYSNAIKEPFPEVAFEWASTISSKDLRNNQMQQVAGLWMQKDQAAARSGITQSNLPENIKTRLLSNARLLGE
jgi:hypothetical protein